MCSENKGDDQLNGHHVAYLCLFFGYMQKGSFLNIYYLFIHYFKRVTHLAVIAILPCDPLCKHIYIYTDTRII